MRTSRLDCTRIPIWLLIAGFLFAACLCCTFAQARSAAGSRTKPKLVIKFATLAPEGSSWMKSMHALDRELREATENRIGFKFYSGGVQGDERDVLRKIRNGQLHGGGFTGYGLGSIAPEVRVLELPFLFESYEEVDFVRTKMDSPLFNLFDNKGMLLLGWTDVGFVNIFSNNPIALPSDLQKAKMWIWSGDPLAELFFRAFDISPIPLAVPDVLTSLQMGVIDAVYASPLACIAVQWYLKVKYMSDIPVTHSLGAVLVAKKRLRSVSKSDLDMLLTLSKKHLRKLTERTRIQNEEAIAVMKKEGIEVVHVDKDNRELFFTRGRKAWRDGIGKLYPEELLDEVAKLVNDYRNGMGSTSETSP